MNSVNKDDARKWMWVFLAALVALQLYFVRELLAALFLFILGFALLAGLALVFFLVDQARQFSLAWVEPRTHVVAALTRRGLVLLEDLSKKPFRRPRSEPAQ